MEQIKILKRYTPMTPEDDITSPKATQQEFVVCFTNELSSQSVHTAMSKLADDYIPDGYESWPHAYIFTVMGSHFYLAIHILLQNLDAP